MRPIGPIAIKPSWTRGSPTTRSSGPPARLVELGLATPAEVEAWEAETKAGIEATVERARHAAWPKAETLFDNA